MAFGKKLAIVVSVSIVWVLALVVGLAVTLTTTTPAGTTTTAVSECPRGVTGWCEWSAWSSCTHSCGNGEKSRFRACSNEQGGIERRSGVSECEGDAIEVSSCNEGQCRTGLKMVTETVKELRRRLNLEDNLFLDRYAQSVTDNGERINANQTDEIGYGIWRLTETQFDKILPAEDSGSRRLDN